MPFAQVRAVSNIVERRNRAAWKMAEAIASLAAPHCGSSSDAMTLTLGFSPCPNDCFMFDAMVHQPHRPRRARVRRAPGRRRGAEHRGVCRRGRRHQAELPRVRVLLGNYVLLDAGSALGRNCGPLLISKRAIAQDEVARGGLRIAIPGKYTTANFLLGAGVSAARRQDRAAVLGRSKVRCSTGRSTPG